jgi:hypothetical protein
VTPADQVLAFIASWTQLHGGIAPTLREVAAALRMGQTRVFHLVEDLRSREYLTEARTHARSARVTVEGRYHLDEVLPTIRVGLVGRNDTGRIA